jgi:hypothetical protein
MNETYNIVVAPEHLGKGGIEELVKALKKIRDTETTDCNTRHSLSILWSEVKCIEEKLEEHIKWHGGSWPGMNADEVHRNITKEHKP